MPPFLRNGRRSGGAALPSFFYEFYSDAGAFKTATLATVASGSGVESSGGLYNLGDTVTYRIYAYYGSGPAHYAASYYEIGPLNPTANGMSLDLNWGAVTGATGYRILRNFNGSGFGTYVDVPADNYGDDGTGWQVGATVTPVGGYMPAANGDTVSKLEDQSGNARHRTQTVAGNRPAYDTASALNGHPSLIFGNSDELATAAFTSQTSFTVFLVVNLTAKMEVEHGPLALSNVDATAVVANFSVAGDWFAMWGSGPALMGGGAASLSTPTLVTVVFSPTAGLGIFRINGALVNTSAIGTPVSVVIAAIRGGQFKYYADMGVTGVCTGAQILAVEAMLKARFGI